MLHDGDGNLKDSRGRKIILYVLSLIVIRCSFPNTEALFGEDQEEGVKTYVPAAV